MATQSRRPEVDIVNWREAVNWLMRHKREQFKELVLQLVKEAVRGKVIPDGVEVHNVPTTRFAR